MSNQEESELIRKCILFAEFLGDAGPINNEGHTTSYHFDEAGLKIDYLIYAVEGQKVVVYDRGRVVFEANQLINKTSQHPIVDVDKEKFEIRVSSVDYLLKRRFDELTHKLLTISS